MGLVARWLRLPGAAGSSGQTPKQSTSHEWKGIDMGRRHLGIALLLIAGISQAARADFAGLAIAGRAGSLGLGGELMANFLETVNGRAGITYFPLGIGAEIGDVRFDFDLRTLTFPLTMDWYPFHNAFHLSGGLIINQTEMNLDAQSNASLTIGGTRYSASDLGMVRGNVRFNPVAPYVGIGWGNAFGREQRWGILTDLGVAFLGSPHVSLSATGPIASDPTFRHDLAREEDDIKGDLNIFRFYPVFSISLFYRF
jgi:hypothetical protein